MEPTTMAIDLGKRVFYVHFVDQETGTIHSKVLKRAQLMPFFANQSTVVGCDGSLWQRSSLGSTTL